MFALFALLTSSARPKVEARRPIGDSSQKCIMCQFYVSMIEDMLEDEKAEEQIEAEVEKLCDFMKDPYKTVCHIAVETFLKDVIRMIGEKLEKVEICNKIKMCKD